jgi:hypothetical protein
MSTEGHLTARQLSARNRGSLGDYMYTGYGAEEPAKPSTPTIGKSVKTYNNQDAASYARRNRGNLSDIMGQSQNYESGNSDRPMSAGKSRSKEAQDSLNKSFGDSMKLVFDHTNETPAADVLTIEEPAAPEPAPEETSPAAETASVVSDAQAETPAAEASEPDAPVAQEPSPSEPAPPSPAKAAPAADSPRAEAKAHALRNRGTLGQVFGGNDDTDRPVSSRGTPRGQRRPDSVADVFNYNPPTSNDMPQVNTRVKREGQANSQMNRISNIF